jgi:hypothetical protein
MAISQNHSQVTEEQVAAAMPLLTTDGERYYEVQSSTGEGYYTLRQHPGHHVFQCNCRAGREGIRCWHLRVVEHLEAIEQDAQASERYAARREQEARAKDGWKCYEHKAFSLLK